MFDFKRDFHTLTQSASKIEKIANAVEDGYSTALAVLDSLDEKVELFVSTLRENAEKLREEATKAADQEPATSAWEGEKNTSEAKTREEKIAFIQNHLDKIGLRNSQWTKDTYTDNLTDVFVDATYKAFGGK